jgi:hypothetical protein
LALVACARALPARRDEPLSVRWSTIDVSAQKQAAIDKSSSGVQLRQSQKMEASARLQAVSPHDFNNILVRSSATLELASTKLRRVVRCGYLDNVSARS